MNKENNIQSKLRGIFKRGDSSCPPSYNSGGIILPHIPTRLEMDNCMFSKSCPAKNGGRLVVVGGKGGEPTNCSTCPENPYNKVIGS